MFDKSEITDEAIRNTELPAWLSPLLPEPTQPVVIDYDVATKTIVNKHSDGTTEEFDDIGKAFYAAEEKGMGTQFSSAVHEEFGYFPSPPNSSEMLITHSEVSELNRLKYSYLGWITGNLPWYEESPDDFMASYYFLDGHPCFWLKNERGGVYDWEIQGFASRLWHHPSFGKDKKVVHMMEAGAHVEGSYNQHYHDLRLDVYADSYENAIIETAALVHKFFNTDGTEREGVEYQKSQLELDLEDRSNEVSKLLTEDSPRN